MNINSNESIPFEKDNNTLENMTGIAFGITLMPMKEVYQTMYGDFAITHIRLANATSAKEIRNILQKIYEYPVDSRTSEQIRNIFEDIKGNVRSMHMNDYTRSEMCADLSILLSVLLEAISEEERQEKIEEARRFFLFMADHAEDFVEWVDRIQKKQ